jgi:hypothetical protein
VIVLPATHVVIPIVPIVAEPAPVVSPIAVAIAIAIVTPPVVQIAIIAASIVVVVPVVAIPVPQHPDLLETSVIAVEVEAAVPVVIDDDQLGVPVLLPVPAVPSLDHDSTGVIPMNDDDLVAPGTAVVAIVAVVGPLPDPNGTGDWPPPNVNVSGHPLRFGLSGGR